MHGSVWAYGLHIVPHVSGVADSTSGRKLDRTYDPLFCKKKLLWKRIGHTIRYFFILIGMPITLGGITDRMSDKGAKMKKKPK